MLKALHYVVRSRMAKTLLQVCLSACLIVTLQAAAENENPAQLAESKTVKLSPLPLNHVRLTGGPLKAAQQADAKYLLELQPGRMLAFLRLSLIHI